MGLLEVQGHPDGADLAQLADEAAGGRDGARRQPGQARPRPGPARWRPASRRASPCRPRSRAPAAGRRCVTPRRARRCRGSRRRRRRPRRAPRGGSRCRVASRRSSMTRQRRLGQRAVRRAPARRARTATCPAGSPRPTVRLLPLEHPRASTQLGDDAGARSTWAARCAGTSSARVSTGSRSSNAPTIGGRPCEQGHRGTRSAQWNAFVDRTTVRGPVSSHRTPGKGANRCRSSRRSTHGAPPPPSGRRCRSPTARA